MSGGSHNYAYRHVEEFADALDAGIAYYGNKVNPPCLARLAFASHLRKVAEAMKAIEWVDSGDCSSPHDVEAIHAVIGT